MIQSTHNNQQKWFKQPVAWLMLSLLSLTIVAGGVTIFLAYKDGTQEISGAPSKLPGI